MAWDNLKQLIRDNVYENHNEEISGQKLQNVLIAIVDRLTLGGYAFKGYATPLTISTPTDGKVAYFGGEGTYDFGITIAPNELALLLYDGSWSKQTLASGISQELIDKLVALPTNAELQTILSAKANIDGYYESMGVGYAKNLLGNGAGVNAMFTSRTTGGTASVGGEVATLKSIKGKTLMWNQLSEVYELDFNVTNTGSSPSYPTITDDRPLHINGIKQGEKIYRKFDVSYTSTNTTEIYSPQGQTCGIYSQTHGPNAIRVASADIVEDGTLNIRGLQPGETCSGKVTLQIFHLTQMFGAGYEPSTPEEFEALFPNDYYAYCEPTPINFRGTDIVTDGFNQFDGTKARVFGGKAYYINGTYATLKFAKTIDGTQTDITPSANLYTPTEDGYIFATSTSADFCINLSWSGQRNGEYEPYWKSEKALPNPITKTYVGADGETHTWIGNDGVGTAYDEQTATQDVQRIGVYDLGNVDWSYNSTYGLFYAINSSIKNYHKSTGGPCICNKYASAQNDLFVGWANFPDKHISSGSNYSGSLQNQTTIVIKDSAYTDAAAFKAAMAGVLLFCELETPIVTNYPTPRDLNYRMDDYGTEEIKPQGVDEQGVPKTAPFVGEIVYAPNVQDTLRRLPMDFASIAASGSPSTINNLLTALKNAGKISNFTITWDSTNNVYNFTIS